MLTAAWTPLKPHSIQSRLWRGPERFVAVCAGRGSGKTTLARRRVVRMLAVKKPWPDPIYFYALPTVGQAIKLAWKPLKTLIPHDWIVDENQSTLEIKTIFGSTLIVLGLDAPMRAEGLQYDGGVVDECSDQKPEVFDLTLRPALTHRKGWCWRIGAPKRRGVGAAEFRQAFNAWGDAHDKIHAAYTWPSTDILPPDEIATLRKTLDEKDYNEQILGNWESNAGLVYYAFHETDSVRSFAEYNEHRPIIVGSDFNVDPMAWVLMHEVDGKLHCFDEIWIKNTNTQSTLDALYERYGAHNAGWLFFGDATARSRKTSATMSDYSQIANDVRFKGAKVYYESSNPRVGDRVAAVNAMLKNAAGDRRLIINPRCLHLLRDLGYLSYMRGSRDIDLRDPMAGHISDALGYPIHSLFPVTLDDEDSGEISTLSY